MRVTDYRFVAKYAVLISVNSINNDTKETTPIRYNELFIIHPLIFYGYFFRAYKHC